MSAFPECSGAPAESLVRCDSTCRQCAVFYIQLSLFRLTSASRIKHFPQPWAKHTALHVWSQARTSPGAGPGSLTCRAGPTACRTPCLGPLVMVHPST